MEPDFGWIRIVYLFLESLFLSEYEVFQTLAYLKSWPLRINYLVLHEVLSYTLVWSFSSFAFSLAFHTLNWFERWISPYVKTSQDITHALKVCKRFLISASSNPDVRSIAFLSPYLVMRSVCSTNSPLSSEDCWMWQNQFRCLCVGIILMTYLYSFLMAKNMKV